MHIPDNEASSATFGDAVTDDRGVHSHRVVSPYQRAETKIHVLLPSLTDGTARCTVVYLLPVATGDARPWGDAMSEVLKHDLHTKHGLLFVQPTFSNAPWYADHPSDRQIWQESHFLKVVLPFVESHYPVLAEREGRMLLGFSKSGWGAFSLLLRNSDLFGKAVAWDAPLGQQSPTKYGMSEVFPTQDALDRYCVWDLLKERAEEFSAEQRFAVLGYGVFRGHHQAAHYRMMKMGIPHEYQDGPRRNHDWHSGWVPGAVQFLADVEEC